MSEQDIDPIPTPQPTAPAERESQAYTPGKLFGVALVGAGCSLLLYYVFQQLEPEQKRRIKGTAFRGVKDQVRGWVTREEPESKPEAP